MEDERHNILIRLILARELIKDEEKLNKLEAKLKAARNSK